MATNPIIASTKSATLATPQPRTYQEMLNYLLPTKMVGDQIFVPRITSNNLADARQLNDFDHWHNATSKDPHTHIGLDLAYSKLNSATGKVDYLATTHAVNQNVSLGAPVGGVLTIVPGSSTNEVRIVTPAGLVFSIMHMSGVDSSLNNKQVAPGTPIGMMDGVGAGGVKHAHLSVFQNEIIKDKDGVQKQGLVYYDPQEVMSLGTSGRYVIKDNSRLKPDGAVDITPESLAFWSNNSNTLGEGQREITATRTVTIIDGIRSVISSYAGQTGTNVYDLTGRNTGGLLFNTDTSKTQTTTGHWLLDSQTRQDKAIQAALSLGNV